MHAPPAGSPDASALAPLLTTEGWSLLCSLPPYEESQALSLGEELRAAGHSPALVSAALTQQRLRGRAEQKFGPFATQMLFTQDGLEQATRMAVSAHHAARYARADAQKVADLGCGIGGDAMALAGLGLSVLAVERDETTAALATVNLMALPQAEVRCGDALETDLVTEGVTAVFADPARRSGGRRLTDPEQWSPRLSQVLALRQQVPDLGLKIAPGTDHELLPHDSHVQWVSVDGEVLEACVWCGGLAPEGPGRSALCLREGSAHVLRDPDCTDPSIPPEQLDPITSADDLGEYVLEPDGAVIRAGLVAHVARLLDARPVGERIAYLTGNTPVPAELAPFVRAWRLRDVVPLHSKALRGRVRERELGRLEIHKRGIEISPDALRSSLRLRGPGSETWLLTRLGPRDAGARSLGPAVGTSKGLRSGKGRSSKGMVLVVEPLPPAEQERPSGLMADGV